MARYPGYARTSLSNFKIFEPSSLRLIGSPFASPSAAYLQVNWFLVIFKPQTREYAPIWKFKEK
jgi:hypothetical protein